MTANAQSSLDDATIKAHLDNLTKPPGSLGKLEDVAISLCRTQGSLAPRTRPRHLAIFAADHGVVQAGVTAWPSEVTGLMIANILGGGAASSVFAHQTDTTLRLVDVGSGSPTHAPSDGYRDAKIAESTANLAEGAAMTVDQLEAAFAVGVEEAEWAAISGARLVLAGEMGIGNTTPAACLGVLLCDASPEVMTGRGAGADNVTLSRKLGVVTQASARAAALLKDDPTAAIAEVAGFEIIAMAGFYATAARLGFTILVDGFITTAAALVAEHRAPGTVRHMIAAHCSAEPGHRRMLDHLGLDPLLDWSLRLGEGTGALLALPLVDAAAAMVCDMATFADAGIEQ